MKATFMYGAGDVRVETVPDPVIQEPADAIVRVVRACICGSDLHPYHSMPPAAEGVPMGHELVGVVEEAGTAVTSMRKGDLVIAPFAFQDNTCVFCREGFQTSCVHGGWYGTPETGGLQAQLARIPLADGSLVAVPGIDEKSGLLPSLLTLSDVYLTGWHAAHMGRVRAYIGQALPDVLEGRITPGKVFDSTVTLDEVPAGYAAMDARTALKVLITP